MTGAGHGGDVFAAARALGLPPQEVLDFSASINPLGMPAAVRRAARAAVDAALHYPEIDGAPLRSALAVHHQLPEEHLLPAGGSTPLFYLLARAFRPRRILLVRPAFSEYRRAFAQAQVAIDPFDLHPEEGFSLDPARLLSRLVPQTDLVLLANPGNPSGAAISPDVLLQLAQSLQGRALLAVDEAFVDFAPHLSLLPAVAECDNLVVFRSLTKFYAIPGLRAGYLAGPVDRIRQLATLAEPWGLSTPALAAAQACLAQHTFRRRTLRQVPQLRAQLADGLRQLGLTVFPSCVNYLLARREDGGGATRLAERLRAAGILIRPCADFMPLDDRYLRLAVRTAPEQGRLLAALGPALAATRAGS